MVNDLKLDTKQQKKVAKLNKKYQTLIEGEEHKAPDFGRPPMGKRPQGGLVNMEASAEVCHQEEDLEAVCQVVQEAVECQVAITLRNRTTLTRSNRNTTKPLPRSSLTSKWRVIRRLNLCLPHNAE